MLKHPLAQILKSNDLIDILCEPEEDILRKSKIRVMTDVTLTTDLQDQRNEIEAK